MKTSATENHPSAIGNRQSEIVNILLVDDRPENLLALETILGDPEYNLVKASSGREALRHLLHQDFAVILLDVQMPEMDGFETAELIRQRPRSEHTPIIFITAIGKSDEFVYKGYVTGAVDYIIKPVVPDILRAKVSVFVDLFRMRQQVQRQAEQLALANRELERRAAELETVNKELEAFSYSVSHDLRAPLRTVDGFSQALLEDYRDKLDEGGQNLLQRIRTGAQRMGELIDALLNLSRTTRAEMQYETVDLSDLVQNIATELQQAQPERQVEFVIQEGVVANGDAKLLRAALTNLLSNAWKFTGQQEKARIEFGVLQERDQETRRRGDTETPPVSPSPPPRVYFVRDNGAGFNQAYANKLFMAFQRLHSASEFPGIGIGLATVQRIIHRHRGRVWAKGEEGKGATFYFTLG